MRGWTWKGRPLVACALMVAVTAAPAASASTAAAARPPAGDWPEFDFDAARSGVGPARTGITAANVATLHRSVISLDGTVDSAPIELHAVRVRGRIRDVVVVTTSYGRTITLDPRTGARLWEFTPHDIQLYEGSYQITHATPIADPNRRYVYAASPDGRIHKLRLSNGREVRSRHWPALITYDASKEKIASALNITGGSVVATTGGYDGDAPVYQGHLVLINRSSGRVTHVWNSLCSNHHRLIRPPSSCPASDSAIWARAGAVVEPGRGRILVATGNGPFNGSTDWGDSVLELSPDASRLLRHWTPTDQGLLNATDTDVGSTSPALLGRHLAVQGGKEGVLDLLDLDRLSGVRGRAGGRTGGELQRIATPGSVEMFTAPVVWRSRGRTYLFVADNAGTAGYILGGGRHPRLRVSWEDGTPGTSPVLAGGLLYVYDQVDGALVVRRPTSGRTIASLPAGTGHWNSPIVVGGRIVLPEGNANDHLTSGTLSIYRP